MTARQVIAAWLAALAVLAAALALSPRIAPPPLQRFGGAQVVAIGSSLMAHALPEQGTIAQGKSLIRVGIAVPEEDQLLALAERAIDERAEVVLLEVTPFLVDFKFEAEQHCRAPAGPLRRAVHDGQVAMVDRLRRIFGLRTSLDGMPEPMNLHQAQAIDPDKLATFYPMRFHAPCESARLRALLQRARAAGTQVYLVLPPRAPAGERALGSAEAQRLGRDADALARALDTQLFGPMGGWGDTEFVDHAHLNASGRARFTGGLGAWLGAIE